MPPSSTSIMLLSPVVLAPLRLLDRAHFDERVVSNSNTRPRCHSEPSEESRLPGTPSHETEVLHFVRHDTRCFTVQPAHQDLSTTLRPRRPLGRLLLPPLEGLRL